MRSLFTRLLRRKPRTATTAVRGGHVSKRPVVTLLWDPSVVHTRRVDAGLTRGHDHARQLTAHFYAVSGRLRKEVGQRKSRAARIPQGRGRAVNGDAEHAELRRGTRGEWRAHFHFSARRFAIEPSGHELAAAGRALEAVHIDRVTDADVAQAEHLDLRGALILEASGRRDRDLDAKHRERARGRIHGCHSRLQLYTAVSVERYDVGDQNVRAIKAPFYLDFYVEGEIGLRAVAIHRRARGRDRLAFNVKVSGRGEAGDETLTLHVPVSAGLLRVAHLLVHARCGQRRGACIEARSLDFDEIAVGRLATGKAREIRGRIIHDEGIDHEGVHYRIYARHRSQDLQRSGRGLALDPRRGDGAVGGGHAADFDEVGGFEPRDVGGLNVRAEGSTGVDGHRLPQHRDRVGADGGARRLKVNPIDVDAAEAGDRAGRHERRAARGGRAGHAAAAAAGDEGCSRSEEDGWD